MEVGTGDKAETDIFVWAQGKCVLQCPQCIDMGGSIRILTSVRFSAPVAVSKKTGRNKKV